MPLYQTNPDPSQDPTQAEPDPETADLPDEVKDGEIVDDGDDS